MSHVLTTESCLLYSVCIDLFIVLMEFKTSFVMLCAGEDAGDTTPNLQAEELKDLKMQLRQAEVEIRGKTDNQPILSYVFFEAEKLKNKPVLSCWL